jgi:hypothetical protein
MLAENRTSVKNLALCFLLPVLIVPNGMVQNILEQGSPPQGTGQGQVSFWCLFDIISEFRCPEPSFFAFHFTICRGPAHLFAKSFKVFLRLSPFFLLHRVTKLTTRKLVPQSFDRSQISIWNVLDIGKVYKGAPLGTSAGNGDESVACELEKKPSFFFKCKKQRVREKQESESVSKNEAR